MKISSSPARIVLAILGVVLATASAHASTKQKKPNILVIWGDDIGQFTSAPTTWA
jgi:hypothetical protein